MYKVLSSKSKAGTDRTGEPRLIGDFIDKMLQSNSPLAKGYRKFLANQVNAEKGDFNNE